MFLKKILKTAKFYILRDLLLPVAKYIFETLLPPTLVNKNKNIDKLQKRGIFPIQNGITMRNTASMQPKSNLITHF